MAEQEALVHPEIQVMLDRPGTEELQAMLDPMEMVLQAAAQDLLGMLEQQGT